MKEWNSLPQSKREKVAKICFYNWPNDAVLSMAEPWHYRIDAEHQIMLKSVYKTDTGYVCKPVFGL